MDLSSPPTKEQEAASFLEMQRVLLSKSPAFIGRLSGNEPYLYDFVSDGRPIPTYLIQNMLFVAGIQFTSHADVFEYVQTYKNAFSECDLIGVWCGGSMYAQSRVLYEHISSQNSNKRKCIPIVATGLEPFYYMDLPQYEFDRVFENKKVLIISSHANTIKSQLSNLDKLFPKQIFHSTTQFYVHKPPQQNAASHDTNSWKFHFDRLKKDVDNIKIEFDFDIALVSCGGFGMPISEHIHCHLGKTAVYVGGALQLFFGIMGRRWEGSPQIKKYVNKYWVRPLDIDKPATVEYCEGGCYW